MTRSWLHLVREFWPQADEEFAERVLWEETDFPLVWDGELYRLVEPGTMPVQYFRTQLQAAKGRLG